VLLLVLALPNSSAITIRKRARRLPVVLAEWFVMQALVLWALRQPRLSDDSAAKVVAAPDHDLTREEDINGGVLNQRVDLGPTRGSRPLEPLVWQALQSSLVLSLPTEVLRTINLQIVEVVPEVVEDRDPVLVVGLSPELHDYPSWRTTLMLPTLEIPRLAMLI